MTAFNLRDPVAEQINSNAQDVVDILLHEWGTDVKDSYPSVLNSIGGVIDLPNFPFTPQALTIGPRSTIDRCWVSWNYESRFNTSAAEMIRTLSVDAPLLFSQASGTGHINSTDANPISLGAMGTGRLYVFPHVDPATTAESADPGFGIDQGYRSTLLPGSYLQADGTLNSQFYNPAGVTLVMRPVLHLQFWLKANGFVSPIRRAPFLNGFRIPSIGAPSSSELIFGWPVYGRKVISLQVRSDVAGSSFRVAALRNVQRSYRIQETTEGLQAAAAANQSVRFHFCDLAADYLMLYTTRPSVGGQPIIFGTIAAYD